MRAYHPLLPLLPLLSLLAALFAASFGPSLAQADSAQRAKEAEEAYHNLELDKAIDLIDDALRVCGRDCPPEERGRLFVLRGIFVHGQVNGADEAREDFKRALESDRSAAIPPMLSTPAIEATFAEAQASLPPKESASISETTQEPAQADGARLFCSSDDDCLGGERCDGSQCVPEDRVEARPRVWDRVFLELGYSLTMATAKSNMIAASTPPLANPGDDPQLDLIPENDSYLLPGTHGCEAGDGEYCVRVSEGLAVFAHGLHLGAGIYITERVGVALRLRYSPGGGQGALSNFLVGARVHYRLTEPQREGFHAAIFGGLMAGQIQVRPKQKPTVEGGPIERPWAATGLGGVEVGAKIGYRITPAFGVFASPEIYALFPDF